MMNKVIKELKDNNVSMSIIEFGAGCPVTNFIMDEENSSEQIVKVSKLINCDHLASVCYGKELSEIIPPSNLGYSEEIASTLRDVCREEYYSNRGVYVNTILISSCGKQNPDKKFIPVYILHCYHDQIRVYQLILRWTQVFTYGRDVMIGNTAAAIAAKRDKEFLINDIMYDGAPVIKAMKNYGNKEIGVI